MKFKLNFYLKFGVMLLGVFDVVEAFQASCGSLSTKNAA